MASDAVPARLLNRHLDKEDVELAHLGPDTAPRTNGSGVPSAAEGALRPKKGSSLKTLILCCMVAAGVQFGWALQLSLLTPYIQILGIEHAFSSFIWLCGPITGFIVQPCVGMWSDKCHSKYGRRRPFIFLGCLMICFAVILIGFSADIGFFLGDTDEHCSTFKGPRPLATAVFVIGFWLLDLANNTVQLFLLLCMSVTLYFAKEIPLEPKIRQHLSDSSPLLKDSEQYLGQFEGDETEKVDSGTLHVNKMGSKGGVTNSLDLEHRKIETKVKPSMMDLLQYWLTF